MPKRDFTVTPMPAAPNSSGCVDNRGPGVMSSPGLPALRIPRNKLSTHSAHGAGGAGPPRRIPRNRCASDAPKRVPRKAAGPLQQRGWRSPRATTLRGIGARARSASGQIVSVGVSLYTGSPVHYAPSGGLLADRLGLLIRSYRRMPPEFQSDRYFCSVI